jgi:hypothetical protein
MTTYTSSLRLVQPADGAANWGTTVNTGLTALVDTSVAGTATITMTAADYTLTNNNGAADEARAMVLNLTGTPGAARNVICPAVSKLYVVFNNTTGGFAQTLKTSAGSGISVPNGATAFLRCDGTNVVNAMDRFLFTSGSAALPSIAINGDTDTGMWSPAANTLAWSNNGAETMRLDASGNLGLGVTPSAWSNGFKALEIAGAASVAANGSRRIQISTNVAGGVAADGSGGTYSTSAQAARYQQVDGVHYWYTAPSGTAGNAISFTEAMRLNASGELLVGTTTSSGAGGITLFNNSGPGFSLVNNNNAAATGYVFESFRRSSVEIGSVTQNGTTAVLYNITSDRRLKDNIVPAPSASDVIDAIQIVSHGWKSAPDEQVKYGVIAQDLHAVAPQAVLQGDDGEEIEKTWGVDYSKLVPMLIKEIQSLRARVAALEQA